MGILIPSTRIVQAMQAAQTKAGFWPTFLQGHTESIFFLKAPVDVVRTISHRSSVVLSAAAASTEIGEVLATAITIQDTVDAPLVVCGVRRVAEERLALLQAIQDRSATVGFFDELARCLGSAECTLDAESAIAAHEFLQTRNGWYEGSFNQTLEGVRDELLRSIDPKVVSSTAYSPRSFAIPLTFANFEFNELHTLGESEHVGFEVALSTTGAPLEQSAWQLLQEIFDKQIYHSPNYLDGRKGLKEQTDILGISAAGLCQFDTKAEGISGAGAAKTASRKKSNVQGDVEKGVQQLIAAIRRVRKKVSLFSSHNGAPITIALEPQFLWHGVVVISEMISGPDWKAIAAHLIAKSANESAMVQVMDLQELAVLAAASKTPVAFMTCLTHRYQQMVQLENAFLRSQPPSVLIATATDLSREVDLPAGASDLTPAMARAEEALARSSSTRSPHAHIEG